jgi:integrase/recombinase XerD
VLEPQTMTTTVSPLQIQSYHAEFLRQGHYLRAWSDRTLRTYRQGLSTLGETPITKAGLAAWMVAQQERGLTRGGINMYARTINSYLSWLLAEGYLEQPLRIRLLPNPPSVLTVLADRDVQRILTYRPQGVIMLRTWALILVLLDTGLRISEALGIERQHVRLDDLMVRVLGKGHRERWVPISAECRKALYRQMAAGQRQRTTPLPPTAIVFGTRHHTQMTARNAYDDIKTLCARMGITGRHVHPHAFRHCFAVSYIRRGGDIYRLSRILGHSSLTTTQLYLRSMGIEHLQEGHEQWSPLTPSRNGGSR